MSVSYTHLDVYKRQVLEAIQSSQDNGQINAERLKKEREQAETKKKGVLDAFFAKDISKEDMKLMNAEYDLCITQLNQKIAAAEKQGNLPYDPATLEKNIRDNVTDIVSGKAAPHSFYGNLLDHITACPGRQIEVHLKALPITWIYVLKHLEKGNGL